jgi:hypothetical protein
MQIHELLDPIRRLHEQIRSSVLAGCEQLSLAALSGVVRETEGDTIYAIDRISEKLLVGFFEREIAPFAPLVLIAEGIEGGMIVLPRGSAEEKAHWRVIMDPIDGTRGLMYQKRSAWILTGVAPNLGPATGLQDIRLAVQTEIPLIKQHLSDGLWAIDGQGHSSERYNRLTGERFTIRLAPSGAQTIRHGFAMLARFFPGGREELAAIDEEIMLGALGPVQPGKASCFEDQYISTGGQLYELMAGHDRFVADLRPLLAPQLKQRGLASGLCCHPYDLCTELVAREMGVIITDRYGQPVKAPLEVEPDISWIGYANEHIRNEIEPLLQSALNRRSL